MKKLLALAIALTMILSCVIVSAGTSLTVGFTLTNVTKPAAGGNVYVNDVFKVTPAVTGAATFGGWTLCFSYDSTKIVPCKADGTEVTAWDAGVLAVTLDAANFMEIAPSIADSKLTYTAAMGLTAPEKVATAPELSFYFKAKAVGATGLTYVSSDSEFFEDSMDSKVDLTQSVQTLEVKEEPVAPTATALTITGDVREGQTITAAYAFADANTADTESGTVITWYADNEEINIGSTLSVIKAYVGKDVSFTVLPKSNNAGDPAASLATLATPVKAKAIETYAPELTAEPTVSKKPTAGKESTIAYELAKQYGAAETDASIYSWVVNDEEVATTASYTFTKEQVGQSVKIIVTPNSTVVGETFEGTPVEVTLDAVAKKPSISSGSGGSTGPSLANKDNKEDVVNTDDGKDVVDVDDKDDNKGDGTTTTPDTSNGLKFTDVPAEKYGWAIDAISNLAEDGIIIGKSETAFDPSGEVTRAEFVAFLVRGLDFEEADTTEFTDVAEDFWGIKEIATAEKAGIFDYIEGETFSPNEVLTRDEMALIAYNVAKAADITLPELQDSVEFDDADAINPNAVEAVDALSKAGIILGNGDGTFAPKGTTIRAAAAKVVNLILVLAK